MDRKISMKGQLKPPKRKFRFSPLLLLWWGCLLLVAVIFVVLEIWDHVRIVVSP